LIFAAHLNQVLHRAQKMPSSTIYNVFLMACTFT